MSGHEQYRARELAAHRHRGVKGQRVGIEVEVEGACVEMDELYEHVDPLGFRLEVDHSLRNDGIEFVSQGPTLVNDALYDSIIKLYRVIDFYNLISNARTGIHVHLDMQNYTLEQVQNIVTMYCLAEPWLYRVAGSDREENIYCVPWYRSATDAHHFRKAMNYYYSDSSMGYVRQELSNACKYAGLYILPLRTYGTLEFRMAPTFKTGEELVQWVRLVTALGRTALEYDAAEDILAAWDADPREILKRIGFSDEDIGDVEVIATVTDCYGVAEIVARDEPAILDWRQAQIDMPERSVEEDEQEHIVSADRMEEMMAIWAAHSGRALERMTDPHSVTYVTLDDEEAV